jgi:hypothetical protein
MESICSIGGDGGGVRVGVAGSRVSATAALQRRMDDAKDGTVVRFSRSCLTLRRLD